MLAPFSAHDVSILRFLLPAEEGLRCLFVRDRRLLALDERLCGSYLLQGNVRTNLRFCSMFFSQVPRKSDLFQKDIFPDTYAGVPGLEAAAWLGGENAEPQTMSLNPKDRASASVTVTEFKAPAKSAGMRSFCSCFRVISGLLVI